MKNRVPIAGLASVLALVVTGCSSDSPTEEGADMRTVTYQPNFSLNGTDAYTYYGIEQGFFEEEGIELDVVPGQTAQTSIDSVVSGNVDIGRTAGTNMIISAAEGQDVISVGTVVQESSFGFLIPDGDEDPTFEWLEDREVLTVAGGPNNSLAPVVLSGEGVDWDSLSLVNVNPAALLSTYGGGQGDAILTSVPWAIPIVDEDRPSTGLLFSEAGVNVPEYHYVVDPDTLDSDPEMIAAFLRASHRSFTEALQNPEEAVEAINAAEPTVPLNEASERQSVAWEEYRCNEPGGAIGVHDPSQWADAVELFNEIDLTEDLVDHEQLYTNEFYDNGDVDPGTC